jgi:hypothetical protein
VTENRIENGEYGRSTTCHVGRGGMCIWGPCPTHSTRGNTPMQCPFRLCHNGHPFAPGIDVDRPGEPNWDWCNTCGEADDMSHYLSPSGGTGGAAQ